MDNRTDRAADLWDKAEECRAMAARVQHAELKADYVQLADAYARLAALEGNIRKKRERPAEWD